MLLTVVARVFCISLAVDWRALWFWLLVCAAAVWRVLWFWFDVAWRCAWFSLVLFWRFAWFWLEVACIELAVLWRAL
jgi:hypothetical protein